MVANTLYIPLVSNFMSVSRRTFLAGRESCAWCMAVFPYWRALASMKNAHSGLTPPDHLRLVPHGIDVEPSRGRIRTGNRLAVNGGCPRRFKQRKGQIFALLGFAQFASSEERPGGTSRENRPRAC